MLAEQLRSGALINGVRITGMSRGLLDGLEVVLTTLADGSTGRYYFGRPVPGTGPRTDFPAGPVGAGRGRPRGNNRPGRRDGEDAGDRHARMIADLTYA